MKRTIALLAGLWPLLLIGSQVVDPSLTTETLTGTWEALPDQHPPLLWHMEIKGKGESYLAQMTVGDRNCVVRRLISSEVTNGKVKLHFASTVVKELPGVTFPDIWIIGSGEGTKTRGVIEWKNCDDPSCAGKPTICFIKGAWTRDVGEASRLVEKAIKEIAATNPAQSSPSPLDSIDVGFLGRALSPTLAPDIPEIGLVAYKGDVAYLRRLIASGVNVESSGKDGRTPLLLAVGGGHPQAVRILLEAGSNVNARDVSGGTALHWAAQKGDDKSAFLLLSKKANTDIQNDASQTPLILASVFGNTSIVRALVEAGANRDLADKDGRTALKWAEVNDHREIIVVLNSRK